ncbi:MAG: flippase [Patescibacteria group bacterium]|nr:flippase [Patescibacteria group bacterium]
MSLTKSIAKNTLFHAAGKFIGAFIGLVIVGLITRYLGTAGYGYYTTIFAYLYFFSVIGDLGLYLISVNELGRTDVDQKKFFGNIWTMRFFSGAILLFLACLIIWFFPYVAAIKFGALIIAFSMLFLMTDQITVSLLQQKLDVKSAAWGEIVCKIIVLAGTLLTVKYDLGFYSLLVSVTLGSAAIFFINLKAARKFLSFHFNFDKEIWRQILKKSWPIATYMIFSMLYFKADTIILSLYHSQSIVGLYGAPYRLLEALIAFPAIFMGLVSPHLSRAWSENNLADFKRIFQKAFDALSLFVWPLFFGSVVLAGPIMNLIAGSAFAASAPILRILMFATGVIFLAHLTTFSVVAVGRQKQMMKFYIFAAACAVTLYFLLIPRFSYWGAAGVTVGVELFILLASYLMVKKTVHFKINWRIFFLSLLSAAIMAAVLSLTNFGLFANVLSGVLIYGLMLYLLGVWKKDLLSGL